MLALAGLLDGGDWLVARSRGARAFGSVLVRPYYAVPLKDGKTEFIMLSPETRACVHALFPHFGAAPCWYLEGHTQQRVDLSLNGVVPIDGAPLRWWETVAVCRPLRVPEPEVIQTRHFASTLP
jgi:hypothetical protein